MDYVAVATALVRERFPDARAAVLAGSAADGRANKYSDLDIVVVISGPPAPYRETVRSNGRLVELFVHTTDSLEYWYDKDRQLGFPTLANMTSTGVRLVGPDVDAVQQRARAHLEAGPIPWTPEQVDYRRYVLTDALDDLRGARDFDERDMVANQIVTMAAELRLGAAGEWLGKGKWMLRCLRQCDPPLADSLMAAHRATVATDDRVGLINMCEQVLDLVGGRLSEGFVAKGPDSRRPRSGPSISTQGSDLIDLIRVEPDDWRRFRNVRLAALAESPEMFSSTLAREQAFDEAEWRRRAARPVTFLASAGDVDVGIAGVYEFGGRWWVMGMWVAPHARGAGVVEALVNACECVVQDAGATTVTLCVMADNPRAHRAYGRLGFTFTGEREQGRDGTDELLMTKSLPPSS
jgi:ribosomal protein S18 acetylase RimI-like enzyme